VTGFLRVDIVLVRQLTELRAEHVLILEALDGRISELECAMPICSCPQGRDYFEVRGRPKRGPWAPSADRYPIPGRNGGQYVSGNVRLAHWFCNHADGGRVGGRSSTHEDKVRAGTGRPDSGKKKSVGLKRWYQEHPKEAAQKAQKQSVTMKTVMRVKKERGEPIGRLPGFRHTDETKTRMSSSHQKRSALLTPIERAEISKRTLRGWATRRANLTVLEN
jgi:hypothetical protein